MHEEDQNLNDLERRLQAHFLAEDQKLDYPSGIWDRLAPRLGGQRRRGWVQRVPAILGASRARQALAASMALVLLIGVGYLGVRLALPSASGSYEAASVPAAATPPATAFAQDQAVPFEHVEAAAPEGAGAEEEELVVQGQTIFTGKGSCLACHTIEGISTGLVGPDLTHIGTSAASRRPGISAKDYLIESIREPEGFVAEGVERSIPGLMTAAITAGLNDDEVAALVEFLLAQR